MSRAYPSVLGEIATDILLMLEVRPWTRRELEGALSTTTAGYHLPRLRERGFIAAEGRPHVYSLTERGAEVVRDLLKESE